MSDHSQKNPEGTCVSTYTYILYIILFTHIIISRSISDPKHPQPFVSGLQRIMSLMYTHVDRLV